MRRVALCAVLALLGLTGCATTEYKPYEAKENAFEGKGGTKAVVDGMEIWSHGTPPRKFEVLGIIDDERPGGIIPMSQLRGDMVKRARQAGGDAIVELSDRSDLAGFYTSGGATASSFGSTSSAYGTSATMSFRRNTSAFAVIKYLD